MRRINTADATDRLRYACPTPMRHQGRSVRVVDGRFECRQCGEVFDEIVDTKTGERLHRSEVEFVGPQADHQGAFGEPTVE
jgi:ribosomal protein L37AE/L43A